jgi:hypothetical protein
MEENGNQAGAVGQSAVSLPALRFSVDAAAIPDEAENGLKWG